MSSYLLVTLRNGKRVPVLKNSETLEFAKSQDLLITEVPSVVDIATRIPHASLVMFLKNWLKSFQSDFYLAEMTLCQSQFLTLLPQERQEAARLVDALYCRYEINPAKMGDRFFLIAALQIEIAARTPALPAVQLKAA